MKLPYSCDRFHFCVYCLFQYQLLGRLEAQFSGKEDIEQSITGSGGGNQAEDTGSDYFRKGKSLDILQCGIKLKRGLRLLFEMLVFDTARVFEKYKTTTRSRGYQDREDRD